MCKNLINKDVMLPSWLICGQLTSKSYWFVGKIMAEILEA